MTNQSTLSNEPAACACTICGGPECTCGCQPPATAPAACQCAADCTCGDTCTCPACTTNAGRTERR